jgi:PAS domain S-box-containing protein
VRSEDTFRISQELLAAIIQSAMDAIIAIDQEQRIILFNGAAEQIFGCSAAATLGKPLDQFIPERLQNTHREHILRFGQTGATTRSMHSPGALYGVRSNGEEFPIEATISHTDGGDHKVYTVILRDMSVWKQTEEALIRSEKLGTVGRLAATMAHEINNPLHAAMNLLYLAQQTSRLDEPARALLDRAQQQLTRAAQVAKQTLGFAKGTLEPTTFRPADVLKGVLALMEVKVKEKMVTCQAEFLTHRALYGVESEVEQVFWNLLNNALDAVKPGGRIRVRISAGLSHKRSQGIRVSVADNGEGISAEHTPHIFEAFFTTKNTGNGLGLWITREIVKKHGGSIRVRSRTGPMRGGTVFSIFLPNRRPVLISKVA